MPIKTSKLVEFMNLISTQIFASHLIKVDVKLMVFILDLFITSLKYEIAKSLRKFVHGKDDVASLYQICSTIIYTI